MAQDENAVMYAVEQVCALYRVQVTREQSRQFNVQGEAGRWRPMFFGSWTDDLGKRHNKGKADFLARPRIDLTSKLLSHERINVDLRFRSVPLWIECKSIKGRQTPDQAAFEHWVNKNGDDYLLLSEDVRPLIEWLDAHGVVRGGDDVALASIVTPMDASALYLLPCKYCGFPRDKHTLPAYGCDLRLGRCNTKLIGKVWSPDLRKGVNHGKAAGPGNPGAGTERH